MASYTKSLVRDYMSSEEAWLLYTAELHNLLVYFLDEFILVICH